MSERRHKRAFLGSLAPRFQGIHELNVAYDSAAMNGADLETIGRAIRGFEQRTKPTTSDGYYWFWALVFRRKRKKVIVAFPWKQVWRMGDGAQSVRSIALYAEVGNTELNELVNELSGVLREFARQQLITKAQSLV